MKTKILFPLFLLSLLISCSKDDDTATDTYEGPPVISAISTSDRGFSYKKFFQEIASPETRKGIVIISHGDGGDIDDSLINAQCQALAGKGYVAITTSYQSSDFGTLAEINQRFKGDMEAVISNSNADFGIPKSRTIIGGLSRGGNNSFAMVLPGQAGIMPIEGIKGVILQCAGGDTWKGTAVLYPVAYMSNKSDPTMGMDDATDFKNGLEENMNANVSDLSGCLIINGSGHCNGASQYKAFIVEKVSEWLP